MIRDDLYPSAQKVIQFLVIEARSMAYDEAPHKRIASLLDDVEYLIGMLHEPRECTDDFVGYLKATVDRCGGPAKHYHEEFAAQLGEPVANPSASN